MVRDAIRLDGKAAIITGGAGGIGFATAQLMTARGARVAIADIALDRARECAGQLDGAIALHLDLEQESSVEAMVATTLAAFGSVQALVNNAVPFDRVVRDYRNVLNLQLGYHRALGDLATTLARIRQTVGVDLLAEGK